MKVLKVLVAGSALTLGCYAAPASAAEIVSPCNALTDLSVQAVSCAGWYSGNLLNNGGSNVAAQIAALQTIGLNWDGNWSLVDLTKVNASGSVFDFNGSLNGDVWIGIKKGNGGANGYRSTGFFRLTASDLDSISLNLNGASSAVVYAQRVPVVPEPATWAMLLIGFGAIGFALRRCRSGEVRLSTA